MRLRYINSMTNNRKLKTLLCLAVIVALSPFECLALCCLRNLPATATATFDTKQVVTANDACCPMTARRATSNCKVQVESQDSVSLRSCCLASKPATTVPTAAGRKGVPLDLDAVRPAHWHSAKPPVQLESNSTSPFVVLHTHLLNCVIRI